MSGVPSIGKVAAVGMFDGVHRGHRHLLQRVVREAEARGLQPAVITFTGHPAELLKPDNAVRLLTDVDRRRQLLEAEGIKDVIALEFTPGLMRLTSKEFLQLISERYGVRCLVVGFNNNFGSDRQHGFDDYRRFGAEVGVDVVRATELTGIKTSSSIIRRLLAEGKVEEAAACLGREYEIAGEVVGGKRLGRTIGFPTANIRPLNRRAMLPAAGVYAVYVRDLTSPETRRSAMLNIGSNPTVNADGDAPTTVEAFIFDFEGDIYGHVLELTFAARLRDERKFPSLEALRAQLERDAATARAILNA